jgi:hypothetical protein
MATIDLQITCKAILEQGENKGKQCWRPNFKDGYCGKHQTYAALEKGFQEGKKKCTTHRCNEFIEINDKYCNVCKSVKESAKKGKKMCRAIIQQNDNKGTQCDKQASNGDYCGKHFERNTLIEIASKNGQRICDDGKRTCINITKDNQLKCEKCLEKTREIEKKQYRQRQLDETICLTCGTKMDTKTEGFKKETVQRCAECYNKLKYIEQERERKERDYNIERKQNIQKHYNEYQRGAIKRNLEFSIKIDDFEELVNSHCYYCDEYNSERVIGLDRLDSSKGYSIKNIVPCCADCNMMKCNIPLDEFIKKIKKIYLHLIDKTEISEEISDNEENKASYIRPRKILEFYVKNKLPEYIELCKIDNRSILFIKKIEEMISLKLNEKECIKYIKTALQSESHSLTLTQIGRHNMSKVELRGYLDLSKPEKCIELYESAHGKDKVFNEDITELANQWKLLSDIDKKSKFDKLLIKFQNRRSKITS